jgi:hypothetical protein
MRPQGVNIMAFCKEYNAQTAKMIGDIIPVEITVYEVSAVVAASAWPDRQRSVLAADAGPPACSTCVCTGPQLHLRPKDAPGVRADQEGGW